MPKFNPGDLAFFRVIGKLPALDANLGRYDHSIVEIVQFEGNVIVGSKHRNEGDWYLVESTEDSYPFLTREVTLSKPPSTDYPSRKNFYSNIGYTPPPRKVRTVTI